MAIAYPLALPTPSGFRSMRFTALSQVGLSMSPYTFSQQVYAHQGEMWKAELELPAMKRADAEAWIAFLLALNGRQGTFLMGDALNATPQGTWSGASPQVNGAVSARARTLPVKNLAAGATWKAGDWLQFGSGATTRLHKALQDGAADGSGLGSIEIWPATRDPLADGDPITIDSAKGIWRLADNAREWSIELFQVYGVAFTCMEAL